jgi:hypothetical protein
MGAVDHTHPETDEAFWTAYRRGPAATDGGPMRGRDGDGERDPDTVADVDHEGPAGVDADAVWARGGSRTNGAATDGDDGDEDVDHR